MSGFWATVPTGRTLEPSTNGCVNMATPILKPVSTKWASRSHAAERKGPSQAASSTPETEGHPPTLLVW